jgi:alpha-L-fucosidase
VWLPKPVVQLSGAGSMLLGCHIDGHVVVAADDVRVVSCSLIGLMSADVDRVEVARCRFRGMNWDCAIELSGGCGHTIDSCQFDDFLVAVRLHDTIGATVDRNRITARWWGVQLIDTEGSVVAGNNIERTMRAVDVDGGTHAEITGNAVSGGDSGCLLQRGAASIEVAGNRWDGCRIGLLAWDSGEFRQHDNTCADLGESDGKLVIGP